MKIIGHRGAKGLAEENSLESIRQAMKYPVDMIEVDVRMQKSTVVLSHDKTSSDTVYCPLTHALSEIDGKVPLNIEIKEKKAVKPTLKILETYDGEVLLSSISFSVLTEIHQLNPDYKIAVVEKWSGVRATAEAGLLGLNRIHMNEKWLWSGFVKSMKNQGYELYAYTVNDVDRAKELKSWGIDGIFTDYPNRFLKK